MIVKSYATRRILSWETQKAKKRTYFRGGVLLDVLQQIDDLPEELAIEVRAIITAGGRYGSIVEKRRKEIHNTLIELGYLEDFTVGEEVLNRKYSKDNLIVELSKRQYDFEIKSKTTKKEMIDYILSNEKAKNKLVKKYIYVTCSAELKECVRKYKIWDFLEELYVEHPYMTIDTKLVDFYYEREKNNLEKEKALDDVIKNIKIEDEKSKKKTFFSRFFKR